MRSEDLFFISNPSFRSESDITWVGYKNSKLRDEYSISCSDLRHLVDLYKAEEIIWPSNIRSDRTAFENPTHGDCREIEENINRLEVILKKERIKKLTKAAISGNADEVIRLFKSGITVLMPNSDELNFPHVFSYYLDCRSREQELLRKGLMGVSDVTEHADVFLQEKYHVDFLMYSNFIENLLAEKEFNSAQQALKKLGKNVLDKFRAHDLPLPSLDSLNDSLMHRSNAETFLAAHQIFSFSEDKLTSFTCLKIQSGELLCASKMMKAIKFNPDELQKIDDSKEFYWKIRVHGLKTEIFKAQNAGNRSKELDPILKKMAASVNRKDQEGFFNEIKHDLEAVKNKIRKSLFGSATFFGDGSRTATAIENVISRLEKK